MFLSSDREVESLRVEKKVFFSADSEEILKGYTTDVYFVRTFELLKEKGLADLKVVADVFATKPGVLAGTEEVLNLLEKLGVDSVWALEEGEEFDEGEVVLSIEGKYSSFGVFETVILGILASSSGWATAAREVKKAAGEKPVLCFGARHVHPAVAPVMERAALVGGVDGVSCILAAKLMGKRPLGTIPHAAVLLFGDTVKAALSFDEVMPPHVPRYILVDTFKDEAEESLRVAEALKSLEGVRLDTPSERGGVTPALVREVKYRLRLRGFPHVKVIVSGGLNPEKISLLKEAGADVFGVGSYITSHPPVDMTMDVKEIEGNPVAKRGRLPGTQRTERLKKMW